MDRMRSVAVLGATGLVGREMIKTLEQRDYPVSKTQASRIATVCRNQDRLQGRRNNCRKQYLKSLSKISTSPSSLQEDRPPESGLLLLLNLAQSLSTTALHGGWPPASRWSFPR